MFFELFSILFAIVPDYGNEYMTKENRNWTSLKNFAPKLDLNHNIDITILNFCCVSTMTHGTHSMHEGFFLVGIFCVFNCCNFAAFHCCFNQTIACCLLLLFLFEIIWFVVINIVSLGSNNTCQEGKNVLFFFGVFFQINYLLLLAFNSSFTLFPENKALNSCMPNLKITNVISHHFFTIR